MHNKNLPVSKALKETSKTNRKTAGCGGRSWNKANMEQLINNTRVQVWLSNGQNVNSALVLIPLCTAGIIFAPDSSIYFINLERFYE